MILEIIQKKLTGIYHLAGATSITRYAFAKLLAKEFNLAEELINETTSDKINWLAKRPKNTSLDVSKAWKVLKK
ncbi:MAG: sugar nucleotide-binding protein [Candidatus Aenigmatarchaeota archaeon]